MPTRTRRASGPPRSSPPTRPRAASRTRRTSHHTAAPRPDSRQRILDAATAEFALRGFAATTVDRIAAHARLNKAMIYYHFHSKKALYRAVLNAIFSLIADRLASIAASSAAPADKLDQFVAAVVSEGAAKPHFAPIMLREVAEGGRQLDEATYTVMARVVRAMLAIVEEGRATGQFQPVDPILLYLTTIWPVMVYLATTPIRSAIARVARFDVSRLDADRFIRHIQDMNRRALIAAPAAPSPCTGVAS